MNVWFVAYVLACTNIVGWFLLAMRHVGWRWLVLLLAGWFSSLAIGVALPLYVMVYLGMPGMLAN